MTISIFGSPYHFITTSIYEEGTEEPVCMEVKYTDSYVSKSNMIKPCSFKDVPSSTKGLVPFTDFFNSIYLNKIPIQKSTGILPPGLLYLNDKYIIFEKPPCFQNISVIPRLMDDIRYSRDECVLYRIPIPWQVYFVKYTAVQTDSKVDYYTSDVKMFFTSGPVSSFEDNVYLPPLTNFYTNSDLCRPLFSEMEDIERYSKDVSGVIQAAYDWIWNSGTNLDLTSCIVQYYLQMKDRIDVSVFNKTTDDYSVNETFKKFHLQSYYSQFQDIHFLYTNWEKYTLDEVMDLQWPCPVFTKNFYSYVEQVQNNSLSSYLAENASNVDQEYWHYDDDNDTPFQCGEEDCECMGSSSFNVLDVMKWAGAWPVPPSTISQHFVDFIKETTNKTEISDLIISGKSMYSRMHESMRDIIKYT